MPGFDGNALDRALKSMDPDYVGSFLNDLRESRAPGSILGTEEDVRENDNFKTNVFSFAAERKKMETKRQHQNAASETDAGHLETCSDVSKLIASRPRNLTRCEIVPKRTAPTEQMEAAAVPQSAADAEVAGIQVAEENFKKEHEALTTEKRDQENNANTADVFEADTITAARVPAYTTTIKASLADGAEVDWVRAAVRAKAAAASALGTGHGTEEIVRLDAGSVSAGMATIEGDTEDAATLAALARKAAHLSKVLSG